MEFEAFGVLRVKKKKMPRQASKIAFFKSLH